MLLKRVVILLSCCLLAGFQASVRAADEEEADTAASKSAYVTITEKPLVLNLSSGSERLSFLQFKADVLVSDDDARDAVEKHMPAVRHTLILALSERDAVQMKSPAAREEVRQQVTQQVHDVVKQLSNNDGVLEVLFTSFLVQ